MFKTFFSMLSHPGGEDYWRKIAEEIGCDFEGGAIKVRHQNWNIRVFPGFYPLFFLSRLSLGGIHNNKIFFCFVAEVVNPNNFQFMFSPRTLACRLKAKLEKRSIRLDIPGRFCSANQADKLDAVLEDQNAQSFVESLTDNAYLGIIPKHIDLDGEITYPDQVHYLVFQHKSLINPEEVAILYQGFQDFLDTLARTEAISPGDPAAESWV